MNLEIIKAIQSIRNDVFNWLFYLITQLGDQIFFILVVVIVYWIYDKKIAFKLTTSFLFGSIFNLIAKSIFKVDRPYTKPGVTEPNMPIVKPILPGVHTEGYSFPSGHSQNGAVLGFGLMDQAKQKRKKSLMIIAIIGIVLVGFSRMYLAQHYLTDVITGIALGLIITYLVYKLIDLAKDKEHIYALYLVPIFLGLMFIKGSMVPLVSGGFVGFVVGYYFEKTKINFIVKQSLSKQLLKVLIGLVGVGAIYLFFKNVIPDGRWNDFFNYFLIALWATLGAPVIFKYGLKNKEV